MGLRHRIDTSWVAPFAIAGIVALISGLLVLTAQGARADRQRLVAAADRSAIVRALRLRLESDREFLVTLAAEVGAGASREQFESRASEYASAHAGLADITFVDAGFVMRWVAPYAQNRSMIGMPMDQPQRFRASRIARDSLLPAYTEVFGAVQGFTAIEVFVPIIRDGRFLGTIGGVYRLRDLLASAVTGRVGSDHLVELVETGTVVAASGLDALASGPASADEDLGLTDTDLAVRVHAPETDAGLLWASYLALVAVALAFGTAWAGWRLRREADRRGQADAALRENEALLGAIIGSTTDAVYVKDLEGRYLLFNKAASEMLDVAAADVLGKDDTALFPEESAAELRATDRRVLDGGRVVTVEEAVTLNSGRHTTYLTTKGPLTNGEGEVVGLFGIARDITDLKQAEADLRERSERLRLALELTKQDVWDFDIEAGILGTTPMYAAMVGADPETFHEDLASWNARLHPDDRDRVTAILQDCLEGRRQDYLAEFRLRREDGTYFWLSSAGAVAERAADGTPLKMIGTHMDVTDRVEAQEELERTEVRLRQMLDSLMEGVHIVGFDWRYIYFNDAYVGHSKYPREKLLESSILELFPGFEETQPYIGYRRCFDERVPVRQEISFVFPDGSEGWFEMLLQPVQEGAFVLSSEITERKLAEQALARKNEELERAQTALRDLNRNLEDRVAVRTAELAGVNRELESFAYTVSHDLRAPLRHVTGFAELLSTRSRDQLDETARHYVDTISDAAARMGTLIDDLLRFSRIGRAEMELSDVDMNAAVREALAELEPQVNGRRIEWQLGDLPGALGDAAMLRQVWVNLLGNAIKYSAPRDMAHIEVASEVTEGEYIYRVKDDGVGFDPRYSDQLFRIFRRLHSAEAFEGNGIGLANVARIVARLGGRVWAESVEGEGATFYFSIPHR